MLRHLKAVLDSILVSIVVMASLFVQACGSPQSSSDGLVAVSLSTYLNNKGIGRAPGQANLDGSRYAYPADQLPSVGETTFNGTSYQFPASSPGTNDNVVALGQTISLPQGNYQQAFLLVTATWGSVSGIAVVHYTDGSTSSGALSVPDWLAAPGVVNTTYRYAPTGTDQEVAHIYAVQIAMDGTKMANGLTLPSTAQPGPNQASLHVFALTLQQVVQGYSAKILDAHSTTKTMSGTSQSQVVEATIENNGTKWFTPSHPTRVTVQGNGIETVVPAVISELGSGEQVIVEIGIKKSASIPDGAKISGMIVAQTTGGNADHLNFMLTAGIPQYSATDASLSQHQAPDWFNNAKFGIFIHWGVYSVPAWAPVGQEYAEWYWYQMHNKQDTTYQHQLQTYGPTFNYDDFIPQFTAANFDPKAWVQLFNQAGAKYFVLASKHHDGFALFQTQYSHRDSVDLGPHKDLVKELFDAAAQYAPNLKRGVYYSLPEWYNPAYHGSGAFSGGPPTQYVTGQPLSYTGYLPVKDYVQDFQKPQMLELIHNYKPDILWCDIGGPNDSSTVLADYFNQALQLGQQVTVNDRCGINNHDFTTPEYSSFSNLVVQKWEATRGIDPRSFGYNAATPDSAYATADQLITSLVDIVSKNGNFLLDIGPRADGTIPAIMQQRLQEIGAWLKVNGEAIYNTTYWSRASQDGNLRFTVRPNQAFYITSLVRPGNQIVVNQPVPIQPGDVITMLGSNAGPLHWSQKGGKLVIDVPLAVQQAGQYAWAFKITWKSR